MLTPEQAKAEVQKQRSRQWKRDLEKRSAALPAEDNKAARMLLGFEKEFKNWQRRDERLQQSAAHLDALSAARRMQVFEAISPSLAAYIEQAWQQLNFEPSDSEHGASLALRRPGDAAATLRKRSWWLYGLCRAIEGLDKDVVWFATWSTHLSPYGAADDLIGLFAAAVDAGGEEGEQVLEVLLAAARGEHEIAQFGRHVVSALLSCSRPEAWEMMERMLLAAQRQEGFRQSILEHAHLAHPEAFKRMLRLVLNENLVRFASVARAVDVWFGLRWDSASMAVIRDTVASAVKYLDDDTARAEALRGDEPTDIYMALWATALQDADAAVAPAEALLKHRKVDVRFTAAWMLLLLGSARSRAALAPALDDEDLRVVNIAVTGMGVRANGEVDAEVAAKLELLLQRVPKKTIAFKPLLWPWLKFNFKQSEVADTLALYSAAEQLVEHVPLMSPEGRMSYVRHLAARKSLSPDLREVLLKLSGDASDGVREQAIELLRKLKITPGEAPQLESLLSRKAAGLRRGVLELLLRQTDSRAAASAERLLHSDYGLQRFAGLEMLHALASAKRKEQTCRQLAQAYAAEHSDIDASERKFLDPLLGHVEHKPTLENGLGLMAPEHRTLPPPLRNLGLPLVTPAAVACIESLDKLVHAYRETSITVVREGRQVQELLGNSSGIENWSLDGEPTYSVALPNLWQEWFAARSNELRDGDGLELVRADVLVDLYDWHGKLDTDNAELRRHLKLKLPPKLAHRSVINTVLGWLGKQHRPSLDDLLDLAETALSTVPHNRVLDWTRGYCAFHTRFHSYAENLFRHYPTSFGDQQLARLVRLALWIDQPVDAAGKRMTLKDWCRDLMDSTLLAHGFRIGTLNEHDVIDALIGPTIKRFELLGRWTSRRTHPDLEIHPPLSAIVDKIRQRVIGVELARGEQPTAASEAAQQIASVHGAGTLVRLVAALGSTGLRRIGLMAQWQRGVDRNTVLSHLVRVSMPAPTDTPADFGALAKEAGIGAERLVELAVFAPQWARFIEHALDWEGFEDGVWWLHAHTKDRQWFIDEEVLAQWTREVADRTALTAEDLLEGAVDVEWFRQMHQRLGAKCWNAIYDAARLASSSAGHRRAQLFADAMFGSVSKTELVKKIRDKRNQDAVRALGLLPLARGAGRDKDVLSRYELMQEMRRTSRQFGSQRQLSEKRCVEIGQANLARSAGFADPLRLQWAMEARAVADLADGPAEVKVGDVTVALAITDDGEPEATITRGGKPLKSVPAAAKSNKQVKELTARRTALKRQMSRMRQSLETMMCRGDVFSAAELIDFMQHPLMRPLLRRLVVIADEANVIGYPSDNGRTLRDAHGKAEPLSRHDALRLAHPYDLLKRGDWSQWQHDCFTAERVQPFKQVFRELYVLTAGEKSEGTLSRRYEGQQVNPSQAVALLTGRGWLVASEEGVRKTFHEQKLTAWLTFQEHFYTPAEIDGLTVESVQFTRRGEHEPLKLDEIPPRIFSEVMRDMDLVVSVAHRGGVDPEASASTVQMRSDLLRETLAVLSIENVRIENNHALIAGQHGRYTVHLGSAVSHVMPGGALFIVPVHSQHRGRLFLPFADDDPKTAEVISKVLLLARDEQIRDPALLDQIRILS